MDIGPSIHLIWPLVIEEAEANGSEEIAPGHVLCGLLKLSELTNQILQELVPNSDERSDIENDLFRLETALKRMGISVPEDSARLRRKLRKLLRNDALPIVEKRMGPIHRSSTCKAKFHRAEGVAKEAGENLITADLLALTLISEPDEAIKRALSMVDLFQNREKPIRSVAHSKWTEAYGRDLMAIARKAENDAPRLEFIRRDAVCRVLAEEAVASGQHPTPIMLISQGERTVASVLGELAQWAVSRKPPKGFQRRRILEIQSTRVVEERHEKETEQALLEIFQRASESKSYILFFDRFDCYLNSKPIEKRFRTLITAGKANIVVGITEKMYEESIRSNPLWSNTFKVVWVHDPVSGFKL